MLDPLEPIGAVDGDRVRADAHHPRAHLHERDAELLDVRLARGVADHGTAGREHGGHQGVLGRGDRRLVEKDVGSFEPARVQAIPTRGDVELGPKRAEREKVGVVPAPPQDIAAGQAELHLLVAREERAREQQRGPDLARECAGHVHGLELAGDADGALVELLDLGAKRADDLEHPAHVSDPRDVMKSDRLIGEQARRDQRERFVLIPCGCYFAT